jgi:Glycosyltransferase 61
LNIGKENKKAVMKEKLHYNHVKFQIRKRWYGEASISNIASDCIELCAHETSEGTRAFYLPNQLDKVVSTHPESHHELEQSRIGAGERQHIPTIAYKINDAYISSSAIYKKNFCMRYPSPTYSEHADDGIRIDPDQPLYAQLFQQSWNQYCSGKIHTLYLFQDFSENSPKVKRYKMLRETLRQTIQPKYVDHLVYLKRSGGGANVRNIVNEAALIEALSEKNFKIVDLEKTPIEDVLAQLLDAKLVVTLEGSHANHSLYTVAEDGALLYLMPPRLFNNMHKGWTEAMGIGYGFVVGDDIDQNSFSIDVNDVLKTIDLML